MQSLHPEPPKHHGNRPVFIHPGLLEATHVFLRRDMLRRPLQQPYDGPFKVLQRKDKVFFLDINGKRVSVSIDRCKPAFFLNTEDLQLPQTKNETPATVEPNATASTPATVEFDPTASTPTQPSTRSGRKVHLPTSDSQGQIPIKIILTVITHPFEPGELSGQTKDSYRMRVDMLISMNDKENMQQNSCSKAPTQKSPVRRRFVEWAQNEIAVVPDFHKRILFSDEAHFWLNGYVNKQNCRIWSEANPQVYVETPLHPEKLTVWCALWAGGILLQKR
ncbi:integrase catalytic domain-containing protein [Trichonephila clavipes]|nr:integrase catalytic domain-containing protein [Trichonephila clavipes]